MCIKNKSCPTFLVSLKPWDCKYFDMSFSVPSKTFPACSVSIPSTLMSTRFHGTVLRTYHKKAYKLFLWHSLQFFIPVHIETLIYNTNLEFRPFDIEAKIIYFRISNCFQNWIQWEALHFYFSSHVSITWLKIIMLIK